MWVAAQTNVVKWPNLLTFDTFSPFEVRKHQMSRTTRPRVLYVEDHEDSREMLGRILHMELIEAKAVGTAAEALLSIQSERFDLYLLDSTLPDLDGFELCRQVRDLDAHTPILFFSGAAYDSDKQKGLEAGANGYISKPDIESLLGRINEFVFDKQTVAA
jgi:DNA-binding response OmpR family regulator